MSKAIHIYIVVLMCMAATAVTAAVSPRDRLPADIDPGVVRDVPVQHDGRWMPLDTLARDVVETVTGEQAFQGRDPVLWLLAWTWQPQEWMSVPLIDIGNAELRAELGLPADQVVYSYSELLHSPRIAEITRQMRNMRGLADPLQKKVNDINEKLGMLQRVFGGQVIRPIPDPNEPAGRWMVMDVAAEAQSAKLRAAYEAWQEMQAAFVAENGSAFAAAGQKWTDLLDQLPAQYRPGDKLIHKEIHFNQFAPFHKAWMVMALGALLSLIALIVRRSWFDVLAVLALVTGFGLLTYGLALRWQIADRIPAANMFESLLFLSWGAGAFAIVSMIFMRDRFVPLTASFIGSLALFLADVLPLDSFIRPIAPVLLDTYWMSIHVPIIMVSYSVLTLAAMIAHGQILVMAFAPRGSGMIDKVDRLHYWYLLVGSILLGAGIVTGSMWAASSWGRYWGWDPKEVWSLIAFLGYLTILHVRADRVKTPAGIYIFILILAAGIYAIVVSRLQPISYLGWIGLGGSVLVGSIFVLLRGRFAMAFKSIAAFWLIIMTYVGVNFILGTGLHSYGFGTGAVVKHMFRLGTIDLSIIAVCCVIYLIRLPMSGKKEAVAAD